MVQCSFKEETTNPDGTWKYSRCVQEAKIMFVNDPCYGLCYGCAYQKLKAELEDAHKEYQDIAAELNKYAIVMEKCIKAMEGSNCDELHWLEKTLKGK